MNRIDNECVYLDTVLGLVDGLNEDGARLVVLGLNLRS